MSALFFERSLKVVVTAILMILFAKYFTPNLFGQLSFAIAFSSIISVIANLGTDSIVVNELITTKKPKNEILGSILWLRIFGAIIIIFLSNLGLLIFKADYFLSIIVFIINIGIIFHSFEVINLYFQSISQFKKIINVRILSLFFSMLLKIFFLYYGLGIIYIAFSFLFDSLILTIFLLFAYKNETLKLSTWVYKKKTALFIIRKGIYLFISGISIVLVMQLDKILLGFFNNSQDLGIYSAATQFSGIWNIIPITMGGALMPVATKLFANDKDSYEKLILNIFNYLTLIGVCICCFIFIFGEKIILFTLGKNYLESAELLNIHIFTILFIFHISIRNSLLTIEKSITFVAIISVLTVLTSFILNIWLINIMGAKGAAYGTLISWCLSTIFFPLLWNRTRRYPFFFINSFIINFKK